jgi:alginate O-acetyltransferase complex protein AlgI
MLFSSLTFLCCFLPLFLVLYFAIKKRGSRNIILLCFSLVFYAWGEPLYIFLMIATIILNWGGALLIGRAEGGKRKALLAATVILDFASLGFFKYASFAVDVLNGIGLPLTSIAITLPIGISFYTFQIVSYVVDVYRGDVEPQKNVLTLGTYVSAFPQLIAGPIVRYSDVAEELEDRSETLANFASGLRRFIVGLTKKVLIANPVAAVADSIFALDAMEYGAAGAWIAAAAYALQIYYDFSGYSDMAIGLGRMMGFNFCENFNHPYAAVSVRDFWRRWHISLSTFFRDYVYIPLGGNRVSSARWVFNMLIVWTLTGLWHGAGYTFILWGLYYGILLIIEKFVTGRFLEKYRVIGHIVTIFSFIFGWVLFRADTLTQAGSIYAAMFGAYPVTEQVTAAVLQRCGVNTLFIFAMIAGVVFAAPVGKIIKKTVQAARKSSLGYIYDAGLLVLLLLSLAQLAVGAYNPFIYFRF